MFVSYNRKGIETLFILKEYSFPTLLCRWKLLTESSIGNRAFPSTFSAQLLCRLRRPADSREKHGERKREKDLSYGGSHRGAKLPPPFKAVIELGQAAVYCCVLFWLHYQTQQLWKEEGGPSSSQVSICTHDERKTRSENEKNSNCLHERSSAVRCKICRERFFSGFCFVGAH